MKWFLFVALLGLNSSASAANLSEIKTVYLLPMSNGLDQYLAIRLTSGAVLQVVTDPAKADAVFTDSIGSGFEQKMEDLYGAKSRAGEDKDGKGAPPVTEFARITSGIRSRGAIFLVERKNRDVLWSVYQRPKDNSSDGLKHAADKIVGKLEDTLKAGKGSAAHSGD